MRKHKPWARVVIVGAAVALAGCARENGAPVLIAGKLSAVGRRMTSTLPAELSSSTAEARRVGPSDGPPAAATPSGYATPAEGATAKRASLTSLADGRTDRYLIKNGTMTVEASDARRASSELVAVVRAARGYVAGSHEVVDEMGRRSVEMEVRVPADAFDRSLPRIEALGKVLDRQITAEDVTEEFVDSQAKLRNLKRTEERLLEHLHRTGRLADTLLVEKELNRVREAVEQLEGRLRFLAHRVQFSSLAVTLQEAPRPQSVLPAATYSSGKEVADAMRSLVAFGQMVWTAAIWLAIWAVVWVPLALFTGMTWQRRRQHSALR